MPLFGPNIKKLKSKGDIDGLIEALENHKVVGAAKDALIEIGEPTVPMLAAAMQTMDGYDKKRALGILSEIGSSSAKEVLASMLDDEDSFVREAAVEFLTPLKDAALTEPLIKLLKDPSRDVRNKAALALGALSWEPANDEERILSYIALEEWGLLTSVGEPAVEPLIEALDVYSISSLDAALTLVKIGGERAVQPLIAMLGREMELNLNLFSGGPALNILVVSATALNMVGEPAIAPLIEELASDDLPTRAGAAFVLKGMGELAREQLQEALDNGNQLIREPVKELIKILDEGEEA